MRIVSYGSMCIRTRRQHVLSGRCYDCGDIVDIPKAYTAKIKDDLVVPDSTEPIRAYRKWHLHDGHLDPPINRGTGHDHQIWHGGECLAFCATQGTFNDHRDMEYHSCGFYGVFSDNHEYANYSSYLSHTVFGVIEAYGRVQVGTHGLRCHKAKIVALHLPSPGLLGPRSTVLELMEKFPDTKFFRNRGNLINAMKVEPPKHRHRSSRSYG